MDDLKHFICRHQPHVIGISEIELKRNVNDHEGTVKLLEDLSINDYKIFLPKSWDTLGTARLLVYARDDLKSVQMHPQDRCYDHVQNITLEIGFGRSKTHFCNFYYREWTSSLTGRRDMESQCSELDLLLDIWRNCTNTRDD